MSIDIIAFGDLSDENQRKLQAFNENIRGGGGEGSHLAIVHPGPNLLSDEITATPILAGDGIGGGMSGGAASTAGGGVGADGGEAVAGGAAGGGFEFGVDPSMDPELALALRMSYEEEKSRQEREGKEKEKENAVKEGRMEGIPEDDEKKPLIDKEGDSAAADNGSGSMDNTVGSSAAETIQDNKDEKAIKKENDDRDSPNDDDKMDTA